MTKKIGISYLLRIFFILFCIYYSPIASILKFEAQAASLYYILDASGSMWGRTDGQIKIEVARNTMIKLITEMPEEFLCSLTVYGHIKKGECSDITEIIPLGKIDRSKAVDLIKKINPKGKTPIAQTIERTVNNLKKNQTSQTSEGENTIILISDGIETCGGEPCSTALALKSSGIKFIMHVVGFDVDKEASEQLACIAKVSGGKYFSSQNAEELLSILSSVQKSVIENSSIKIQEKFEPQNSQPVKEEQKVITSSKSLKIKAKSPGKITFKRNSWLKKPYSWKLIDPETGEDKGNFSTLEPTIVTPGNYQIVWKQYEHDSSDVHLTEVIQLEAGKTVEIPLMTAIRLNLPSWVIKPKYWGLRDPITLDKVVIFTKLEPFLAPAGEYEIIWRQEEHSARDVAIQKANIITDKMNDITISTAINPVPANWVQKKVHYWGLKHIKNIDSKNSSSDTTSLKQSDSLFGNADSEEFVAWFGDTFAPQLVPPGKYRLIYDLSEHGSSDSLLGEIEVIEGKMNDFEINTGVMLIPSDGMKPPYFVEFIELNEDESNQELDNSDMDKLNKVKLSGNFGPIALKPGKYRINYRQEEHGASTVTIVDEFELKAGNLVEIEL
ncbi:MAG: VWA domain-containing protein [Oligoflexia bacterium]|nr:VWA domain-containing protein [Oligoflexia bacterium]